MNIHIYGGNGGKGSRKKSLTEQGTNWIQDKRSLFGTIFLCPIGLLCALLHARLGYCPYIVRMLKNLESR